MLGYIRQFKELRMSDIPLVGGKTASLGEMYNALSPKGIDVPDGFAITASAYRDALQQAGAWDELNRLLEGLRTAAVPDLAKRAASAREIVYRATGTDDIRDQIFEAYRRSLNWNTGETYPSRAEFCDGGRSADREFCGPA